MIKDIDYKDYEKAWETLFNIVENMNDDTLQDDPDRKKIIAAYEIIQAFEKQSDQI